MELIGKLESNNTSKIGMLPSVSKYVSIKCSYQCINIINNKDSLNVLKGRKIITIQTLTTFLKRSKKQ